MTAKPMEDYAELVTALKGYEQTDEEGIMVLVSRQACDEAADVIGKIPATMVVTAYAEKRKTQVAEARVGELEKALKRIEVVASYGTALIATTALDRKHDLSEFEGM